MIASPAAAPALMIAVLLVLAGGALLVCPQPTCPVPAFDAAGLTAVSAWRTGWLDRGFMLVSWLGSLLVLLPAAVLLAWRARSATLPRAVAFVPAALIGAALLARLVKLAIERPRPGMFPALIAMPEDASFPSAHAMQVSALVVAWLLRPGARPGPGETLAGALLIAAVALSRVYLQEHFPSDVAFGIAAALFWVVALRCLPFWHKAVA